MQKLRHKVSSLVQNFPIPGHNWKLDIAQVKEIFSYVAIHIVMRVISRFAIKDQCPGRKTFSQTDSVTLRKVAHQHRTG